MNIYLILSGRCGNQLFMYAAARQLQMLTCADKIIINDRDVQVANWINSLKDYNLPNVNYVCEDYEDKIIKNGLQGLLFRGYLDFILPLNYKNKYRLEKKLKKLFNYTGLVLCQNGFMDLSNMSGYKSNNDIVMLGYFQSHYYFKNIGSWIKKTIDLTDKLVEVRYPYIYELKKRNSVCLSIKVEHYEEGSIYDVCNKEYWDKAINYILAHVENPYFFICSDNVDYVLENYIDKNKYDAVCQPSGFEPTLSLCAMSKCKNFIIGNTTFGWWAQYLSDNKNKIVVAPSRWMAIDIPIDLYQDNWFLIEV